MRRLFDESPSPAGALERAVAQRLASAQRRACLPGAPFGGPVRVPATATSTAAFPLQASPPRFEDPGAATSSRPRDPDPPPTVATLIAGAVEEERRAADLGITIATLADDGYPALLREIPDPPPVLYIRGDLEPDDEVRAAVVGSRHASRYGLAVAEGLGEGLARHAITVVSGLARGIDAAAHRGALAAGGRTVAVLGSGIARLYPREHADLATRIASQGAVISEYPLGLAPFAACFPRRNRVISGLSAAVVVVEAAKASGALGTARLALEQGRELCAVPGSILSPTSEGTNGLLREGVAHFVVRTEDVLAALPAVFRVRLGLPASPLDAAEGTVSPRSSAGAEADYPGGGSHDTSRAAHAGLAPDSDEGRLAACLSHENGVSIDDLIDRTGLPVQRVLVALSGLELRGIAVSLPGNRVGRARAPAV